jgi:hypothetical protein
MISHYLPHHHSRHLLYVSTGIVVQSRPLTSTTTRVLSVSYSIYPFRYLYPDSDHFISVLLFLFL